MWNEDKIITRSERNRKKSKQKLKINLKPHDIYYEENKKITRMDRLKILESKRKKIKLKILIPIIIIFVVNLFIVLYFKNHFYFGSTINCINVSGKNIEEAYNHIKEETDSYVLTIKGRNKINAEISGQYINLKCNINSNENIKNIKEKQKYAIWFFDAFNKKEYDDTKILSYDEKLLNKYIESLDYFNEENIIYPQNPSFKYSDNKYEIVDEINGTKVDKDKLYSKVKDVISKGKTVLDLEINECYEKPVYTSKSKEVLEAKKILNQYKDMTITYILGSEKEIIDGNTMINWFKYNENFEVSINQEEINNYLYNLSEKYNTVGKTRDFVTSKGNTVQVTGGDYGWIIDNSKEFKEIIKLLNIKESAQKEPSYSKSAMSEISDDIGKTYVEINLSDQHLYFYKDGRLITEGDIVTGNVIKGYSTPPGVYSLKYKQRNAVLVGDDYRSPVNFWMPFNNNIGIHDASWRGAFGGEIYIANGSHGCVNAPYYLANDIFYNIDEGTPIVCY